MAEHDQDDQYDDGTIGLEDFEKLDPDVRTAVLQLRRDLRAVELSIEGRTKRTATRAQVRARLAEEFPDRYGDNLAPEAFDDLMLLADTWIAAEEIIAEKKAKRADEHPDGKWALDSLRIALAEQKPSVYGKWDNTQLAAMLRKEGIPVITIRIGNKTHKGIRKSDLDRLMADREARRKGVTRP